MGEGKERKDAISHERENVRNVDVCKMTYQYEIIPKPYYTLLRIKNTEYFFKIGEEREVRSFASISLEPVR